MSTVRVINPTVVTIGGMPRALKLDEPFDTDKPADAEVVRLFPWAFTIDNSVEAATAAPGERRNVKR